MQKVGSVLPDISTNTSRICYYTCILDRNRSNIREIQLRHNLAYKILDLLFLAKKCPAILASTTFLLSLI